MHTKIRYEIEWPNRVPTLACGSMNPDEIEWSFEYRATLNAARAFAKKACGLGDVKVAYVTKETYRGPEENPRDKDWRWERDPDSREEFAQ